MELCKQQLGRQFFKISCHLSAAELSKMTNYMLKRPLYGDHNETDVLHVDCPYCIIRNALITPAASSTSKFPLKSNKFVF